MDAQNTTKSSFISDPMIRLTKFASWPEVYIYPMKVHDEAEDKLALNTESSVVAYAVAVEEVFRTKAIGFTRGDKTIPWSIALIKAQEVREHLGPQG